jgi:hypothetical protein
MRKVQKSPAVPPFPRERLSDLNRDSVSIKGKYFSKETLHNNGFPGAEQSRGKAKHGNFTKITLRSFVINRYSESIGQMTYT